MIIGITGPAGSGKDTAADYLAQSLGGVHVSGGNILRGMLSQLDLEPKKTALGDFGTFLRTHYGEDIIATLVLEKAKTTNHVITSGFRSPAEAKYMQQQGITIVYIEAPDSLRHTRIQERSREHDTVSVESLKKLDAQEHSSTTHMGENLEAVRALADVIVINDQSLSKLHAKLDALVTSLDT